MSWRSGRSADVATSPAVDAQAFPERATVERLTDACIKRSAPRARHRNAPGVGVLRLQHVDRRRVVRVDVRGTAAGDDVGPRRGAGVHERVERAALRGFDCDEVGRLERSTHVRRATACAPSGCVSTSCTSASCASTCRASSSCTSARCTATADRRASTDAGLARPGAAAHARPEAVTARRARLRSDAPERGARLARAGHARAARWRRRARRREEHQANEDDGVRTHSHVVPKRQRRGNSPATAPARRSGTRSTR